MTGNVQELLEIVKNIQTNSEIEFRQIIELINKQIKCCEETQRKLDLLLGQPSREIIPRKPIHYEIPIIKDVDWYPNPHKNKDKGKEK